MRIAFLPNWCKYLSLVLFVASFILGINDIIRGYEAGLNASKDTHDTATISEIIDELQNDGVSLVEYLSDSLLILSMIVYILSKDKSDDEYINSIRGKSLMIALLIGLVSCFAAYAFGCYIQGIWLLLIQFLSYIIVFKISKVVVRIRINSRDGD